eukprot:789518-Rhodomonas_salina.1
MDCVWPRIPMATPPPSGTRTRVSGRIRRSSAVWRPYSALASHMRCTQPAAASTAPAMMKAEIRPGQYTLYQEGVEKPLISGQVAP